MKGAAAERNRQPANRGSGTADSSALTEQLRILEAASRALEPAAAERSAAREAVTGYAEDFLDRIGQLKAFEERAVSSSTWRELEISEEAIGIGDAMRVIGQAVDGPGLNPASEPQYLLCST